MSKARCTEEMLSRVAWLESTGMIWGTGACSVLAEIINKQLVYFVCFQLLFLLMMLKQEQESTSSPQILKIPAQAFQ